MDRESFSSRAKTELCRDRISRACCAQAEAYGVLLFCNTFLSDQIRIVTTLPVVAKRLQRLFQRAFAIEFDHQPQDGGGKHVLSVTDPDKLRRILDCYGCGEGAILSHHLNYAVLEESCCQAAFLRGAFLAGGSILDPQKRYHLEFSTSHYHVARELQPLMAELELHPKVAARGANYVIYFKQSEVIADFLTAIGAPLAAMEIMTTKIEKNIYNKVNRRSNCDMANLDKAVAAAQKQISAIRALKQSPLWDTLPDTLKQTAILRVENPELPLSQLAELGGISKSCLNHRLRKLSELSEQNR